MGLVGGIIAAPCTGPPLAVLLAYVATTRDAAWGFALLATYGAGVGLPFWLLAGVLDVAAPAGRLDGLDQELLRHPVVPRRALLPQERRAAARRISRRPTPAFALAMAAMVAVGVALGAIHASFHGSSAERCARAWASAWSSSGCSARINYVLTPKGDIRARAGCSDETAALADARAAGRPLLVDFAADWCVPCKEFDVKVFSRPEVAEEMRRFTLLRVDLSKANDDPGARRDQEEVRRRHAARGPHRLARRATSSPSTDELPARRSVPRPADRRCRQAEG